MIMGGYIYRRGVKAQSNNSLCNEEEILAKNEKTSIVHRPIVCNSHSRSDSGLVMLI
jgi:hypothetical protein